MHIKSMLCIYGKPNNSCYCKEDPRMHSHINCGCLTRWRRSPYAFARTGSRKLKGEREIGERPSSIPPSFLALSAAALFPTSVSDNLSFHWEVRVCHDEAMEKKRGNLSHAYSVQFVSLRGTTVVVEVEVEGKPAGFLFFFTKLSHSVLRCCLRNRKGLSPLTQNLGRQSVTCLSLHSSSNFLSLSRTVHLSTPPLLSDSVFFPPLPFWLREPCLTERMSK